MKSYFIIGLFIVLAILVIYPDTSAAQGSRCIILEKDGNRALVSCNGSPSKYVDLRGKADMYSVGDSIDISEPHAPVPESRSQRHK